MTLILNLISHTGWMGSIDLHISRQNPSIETTTSSQNENLDKKFLLITYNYYYYITLLFCGLFLH